MCVCVVSLQVKSTVAVGFFFFLLFIESVLLRYVALLSCPDGMMGTLDHRKELLRLTTFRNAKFKGKTQTK